MTRPDVGELNRESTYGNLKIDQLLSKCAHLVVEAEPVLADLVGREYKVALALLGTVEDDLLVSTVASGPDDRVVDIKRSTRLYSEIKCDLGALVVDVGEEACFLVRLQAVGQGGGVDGGAIRQQQTDNRGEGPHGERRRRINCVVGC
jgi:hypothetical protein